jgi:hypothetical protein
VAVPIWVWLALAFAASLLGTLSLAVWKLARRLSAAALQRWQVTVALESTQPRYQIALALSRQRSCDVIAEHASTVVQGWH